MGSLWSGWDRHYSRTREPADGPDTRRRLLSAYQAGAWSMFWRMARISAVTPSRDQTLHIVEELEALRTVSGELDKPPPRLPEEPGENGPVGKVTGRSAKGK